MTICDQSYICCRDPMACSLQGKIYLVEIGWTSSPPSDPKPSVYKIEYVFAKEPNPVISIGGSITKAVSSYFARDHMDGVQWTRAVAKKMGLVIPTIWQYQQRQEEARRTFVQSQQGQSGLGAEAGSAASTVLKVLLIGGLAYAALVVVPAWWKDQHR